MSLASQITLLAQRVADEFKAAYVKIGTLSSLTTTAKTSTVAAINEVNAAKEPSITAGTTAQYLRGNKTLGTFLTDVMSSLLTGISFSDSSAVLATDTLLASIGKLAAGMAAFIAQKAASNGLASMSLFKINLPNNANTFISTLANTNTAARAYTLPDASGVLALVGGGAPSTDYIRGFAINVTTAAVGTMNIASGVCSDSNNTVTITGTAIAKKPGTWAAGNNGGGFTTSLVVSGSYHMFACIVNGAYDVFFDSSLTGSHAPTGTTALRYIGSFKVDASENFIPCIQVGQYINYLNYIHDGSGIGAGTAALITLSVPSGISVLPMITASNSAAAQVWIWSGLLSSTAPGAQFISQIVNALSTSASIMTNTSSQIYCQSGTGGNISLWTSGFINPRVALY